ncbi:MAG: type II toxin-antitoxin system VapC family toxin [Bradymonadales bacterium]|nr:type II toxin-antitoxin system VapC family toxin [Bradymonadales bacterium]
MRFWDSSAIVPLLVEEETTTQVMKLLESGGGMVVWWGTPVEVHSALSRVERVDPSSAPLIDRALERLGKLVGAWHEVQPVSTVRDVAIRLLRTHPLAAADALQLAAAIAASENDPSTLELVCLDRRLAQAARLEGFKLAMGISG